MKHYLTNPVKKIKINSEQKTAFVSKIYLKTESVQTWNKPQKSLKTSDHHHHFRIRTKKKNYTQRFKMCSFSLRRQQINQKVFFIKDVVQLKPGQRASPGVSAEE